MALQRGSVIPLDHSRTRLVELRIADKLWARGEMVEADGELAVRLTERAALDGAVPGDASPPARP